MEELGIAARVKAHMEEVNKVLQSFDKIETSAGKVDKAFKNLSQDTKTGMKEAAEAIGGMSKDFSKELDEPTKKLIDQIRKLSDEGSDDLKKIRKAYDDLQKAGGKATKDQIQNFRNLINEYKAFSVQRLEPTQLFERAAAAQLKARLGVGDLPPEMAGPLTSLQQQMQMGAFSRLQRAEVDVMAGRAGEFGAGAPIGSDWETRMKGVGAFFLGASVTGMLINAIHHWAMVDKQLIQIEQRFGNIRKEVEGFGTSLGYTKAESAEMAKIWGEIDNRFNRPEAAQYVGFARYRGIEPAQAMQLRLAGRYVGQGRAVRELAQFEDFARDMGMLSGRIEELIGTHTRLARIAADQALGLTTGDIRGIQMFTRRLWQNVPGEEQRGMGEWGAQFIQRLNAGISQPGSDAARTFLMRAYGFGRGTTLTQAMERIEAGIFGRGNLEAIINRLYAETPGMGREERIMALRGLVPQLGIKDIRQLISVWESPEDRKRVLDELIQKEENVTKDFEKLGEKAVGLGDQFKVFMDDLRYSKVQDVMKSIELTVEGDFKNAIDTLTSSFDALDIILNIVNKKLHILDNKLNEWTVFGRSPDSSLTYQPYLHLDTMSISEYAKYLHLKSTTEKK